MEMAEYNRHSRARVAETAKDASRHATPDAPERIDHRRRCTRNDHRTVLLRIARERVPTVPHVAKTRRNAPRRIAQERVPHQPRRLRRSHFPASQVLP